MVKRCLHAGGVEPLDRRQANGPGSRTTRRVANPSGSTTPSRPAGPSAGRRRFNPDDRRAGLETSPANLRDRRVRRRYGESEARNDCPPRALSHRDDGNADARQGRSRPAAPRHAFRPMEVGVAGEMPSSQSAGEEHYRAEPDHANEHDCLDEARSSVHMTDIGAARASPEK